MRLFLALLLCLCAGCVSGPRASLRAAVDGPLRIEGFSGGLLELANRGPAQLHYEYRSDSDTLAQGEIGVGVRLRIDLTGVHQLLLDCRGGDFSELELRLHGAGDLLLVPLRKE